MRLAYYANAMPVRQESQSRVSNGRERQRNRTRRAVVNAAAELLQGGHNPTVAEAAEQAEVSRATAYRYFPTREALLAEVALFAVGGPLLPSDEDDGALPAAEAVARLVRRVGEWAYANEQPLRNLLRISLDPESGVMRPGHRVSWIADVLAAIREKIDPQTYDKLATSLTLYLGIDPVVVMTDIAGVSREQALDALEWSARTLVEGALRTAANTRTTRKA
jgi:AcrR family transcriptional regulator